MRNNIKKIIVVTLCFAMLFFGSGFFSRAYAIPPPASYIFLFTPKTVLNFVGNIFSWSFKLISSTISGGDIVGRNESVPGTTCPTGAKWCIDTNSYNWDSVKQKMIDIDNVARLKTRSSGNSMPSNLPAYSPSDPSFNPEGAVYYEKNGNVVLLSSYSGRGTIIVEGNDVIINGDISCTYCSIGVIALKGSTTNKGNIKITGNITTPLKGAFFAEGEIDFRGATNKEIGSFSGILVAENIILPKGGDFRFDPVLAKYPPPGFREVIDKITGETSP